MNSKFADEAHGEGWLLHQIGVLPFQETSTAWRNEPIGTSRGSGKGSFKSCIWGERTLCPSTGWGTSGSSSAKKDQGILVDKKLTVSQHCTRETKTNNL